MFVCIHAFCMRACASAIWKKIKIIKISDNLKNIYSKYIILPERARLQRISISCILWAPPSPCFPLSPPLHYLSTSPDNIKKLPEETMSWCCRVFCDNTKRPGSSQYKFCVVTLRCGFLNPSKFPRNDNTGRTLMKMASFSPAVGASNAHRLAIQQQEQLISELENDHKAAKAQVTELKAACEAELAKLEGRDFDVRSLNMQAQYRGKSHWIACTLVAKISGAAWRVTFTDPKVER